jgi:hypothetical protein
MCCFIPPCVFFLFPFILALLFLRILIPLSLSLLLYHCYNIPNLGKYCFFITRYAHMCAWVYMSRQSPSFGGYIYLKTISVPSHPKREGLAAVFEGIFHTELLLLLRNQHCGGYTRAKLCMLVYSPRGTGYRVLFASSPPQFNIILQSMLWLASTGELPPHERGRLCLSNKPC